MGEQCGVDLAFKVDAKTLHEKISKENYAALVGLSPYQNNAGLVSIDRCFHGFDNKGANLVIIRFICDSKGTK